MKNDTHTNGQPIRVFQVPDETVFAGRGGKAPAKCNRYDSGNCTLSKNICPHPFTAEKCENYQQTQS